MSTGPSIPLSFTRNTPAEQVRKGKALRRDPKSAVVPLERVPIDDRPAADLKHLRGGILQRHAEFGSALAKPPGMNTRANHAENDLAVRRPAHIGRPGNLPRQVKAFQPLEPRPPLVLLSRRQPGRRAQRHDQHRDPDRRWEATSFPQQPAQHVSFLPLPDWLGRHT